MTNNINVAKEIIINAKTAATHPGVFHLDDTMAAWFTGKFNPNIQFVRSRVPDVINAADFAFDVGGEADGIKKFDHHQQNAPTRPDGQKLCAFGQMWQVLGREFLSRYLSEKDLIEAAFRVFDQEIVLPIDRRDNGAKDYRSGELADLGVLIGQFNSFEDPFGKENDKLFLKAVEAIAPFMDNYVELLSKKIRGAATIKRILMEAAKNGDYIAYVPQGLGPWKEVLTDPEIWAATLDMRGVLVAQAPGKWGLTMWPRKAGPTFELRWILEQSLKEDFGMEFIHQNGFFGVFKAPSLEEALEKAKKIVSEATKVRYEE